MMWNVRGRETKQKDRSRSPHPPLRRSPSPAFPVAQANSAPPYYNPDPYGYSYGTPSTESPFYPQTPSYGQFLPSDYPPVVPPRIPSPSRQYPAQQVIHVIHHSKHHSKDKHKHHHSQHKHHHSHSEVPSSSTSYNMPSPNAITPTSSYSYNSGYIPSGPPPPQPQQRVHFSHLRPALIPTETVDALALQFNQKALLTKAPRRRTTSQPTIPVGHTYVRSDDAAHTGHTHGYVQDPRNPDFRYSTCSGRRKAVCIGINYRGQQHELRGCMNDANNVRRFLIEHGGYRSRDIYLLTDDATDPQLKPTRSNMLRAMRWLVKDARQNDALFFHYSGHGGQTRDLDGDEMDGFDEVIYPVDFTTAGHIVDDELHDIMVKRLPQGCRLTALFDACHSGTVLDLPYMYSSHGRLKGMHISARHWEQKATAADVISWSGCMDDQTSADTFQGGVAVGAMSYAFTTAWKTRPVQTYQEFLSSLRKILNPRYSQKPQLGSSHKIDINLQFIF